MSGAAPRRRCRQCRTPERVRMLCGAVRVSNLTPHSGLCITCVNRAADPAALVLRALRARRRKEAKA